MPTSLIVGLIILIVIVVALAALKTRAGGDNTSAGDGGDYKLRPALLSPAERSFLGVLETVLPDGVGYLAKVRLGDVFMPKSGLNASRRTRARNRINQKHVDFLLIRTTDLKPVAGIELDDRSHEDDERKQRDAFVVVVFKTCKLPLVHIAAKGSYSPMELKAVIANALPPFDLTSAS